MSNKNANIGARLDRLPNSGWHIKMWLVSAFALLVCWSNGIGGAVQNVLLNELHWLEPGSTLLAMWGTTYTAGQLFGALVGGPIGDKIGRKKSILLYEVIHIIAMIGGAAAPNVTVLYVFRLIQGFGLGALLVVLFAAFTEYVPGKNRGVWSSRNSFIGNFAHPICNGIALVIVSTGVSMNMNWRIQYIIPSVLSIIASIIIYNKYPESPRWLESQGRVEEADAIMTSIEKEIEASTGKPLPPVEAVEAKAVKNLPYSALFKGKLLKRTINEKDIYKLVTDIANYSNVAAFGYMQSQSVAQNLQYDLQTCHKFIHTSMKYSDQIEYINNADSSNLIIILSESGTYFKRAFERKTLFRNTNDKPKIYLITCNSDIEIPYVDYYIRYESINDYASHPYSLAAITGMICTCYAERYLEAPEPI